MIRAACLVLSFAATAHAAPPPKEPDTSKLRRIWGETVDPDKDCVFSLDGEKLKVTVPAKSHLFLAATHNGGRGQVDNAPRTSHTVTGDFTLTVKWAHTLPVADKAIAGGFAGVGLYVLGGDSCSAVNLHHTPDGNGVPVTAQMQLMGRKTNSSTRGTRAVQKGDLDKPMTVKMVREGNKIVTTYTTDGKKWVSLWSYEGDFPAGVTVGVFAENTGGKGYEAVFEGLTIDTGEKK